MTELHTSNSELILSPPDPIRDAIFAYQWFSSADGTDTLLKMGNAPKDIVASTLDQERATIEEFIELERAGTQKTWMMRYGNVTIGAAWIDLVTNNGLNAPSVHLMIGDPSYRGRGLGAAAMGALIDHLKQSDSGVVYSRHLTSNSAVIELNKIFGFEHDGPPYVDENGLKWQNVKLDIE